MSLSQFSSTDFLVFSCGERIPYGKLIRILTEPKLKKDTWVVNAVVSPSKLMELRLNKNKTQEHNFIVLQGKQSGEELFSHHAISVNLLEQTSQKIEDNIINILRKIRS